MTLVLSTPEDVINAALVRIGYKARIGSIFEGSDAASAALDIYSQTRDDMLRTGDWGFARRDITLTLLKTAPAGGYAVTAWNNTYPPLPWNYEYQYPSDCLKVRALRLTPIFLPDFDPQPVVFDTPNDVVDEETEKVIVAMIGPTVVCTYAGQVTDPTQWEASFTEALVDRLAKLLAPMLNEKAFQAAAVEEQSADVMAAETQG